MAVDPNSLPKGPGGAETPNLADPFGRTSNEPGYYKHEASGAVVIVMPDAKSTGQQDALVRMGYVWFQDPPTRLELQQMQQAQAKKDNANTAPASTGTFGQYDPDAPRHNPTSTIVPTDSPAQSGNNDVQTGATDASTQAVATAEARAEAAEAELAALKAQQTTSQPAGSTSTPDPAPSTGVSDTESTDTSESEGSGDTSADTADESSDSTDDTESSDSGSEESTNSGDTSADTADETASNSSEGSA